jgi:hypothetical protein
MSEMRVNLTPECVGLLKSYFLQMMKTKWKFEEVLLLVVNNQGQYEANLGGRTAHPDPI